MNALKRVVTDPWLVALLWAGQIAVAIAFGSMLSAMVSAAMVPFSGLDDTHRLGAVAQLLMMHPSVAAGAGAGLMISALVGLLAWTLVAGLIIGRLHGDRRGALGSTWVRTLPGVAVTSLWHLLLRVVGLALVAVSLGPLPAPIAGLVLLWALAISTLALDISRVQVVLHDAPGFHIRTAAYGYVQAVRRWRLLARIGGPWLLQMGVVGASVVLGLASLGGSSQLWTVRVLSFGGVVFGLWRLALVIEAGPVRLGPSPADAEAPAADP